MEPHADAAIRCRGELLEVPRFNADEPVLAQTFPRPEPGKDHRNAAPDRLSLGEPAALAHKEQRRLVLLLELRDVGPVQIYLRRAPGGADFEHGQFVLAVEKGHPPEDFGFSDFGCFAGCHTLPRSRLYLSGSRMARKFVRILRFDFPKAPLPSTCAYAKTTPIPILFRPLEYQ